MAPIHAASFKELTFMPYVAILFLITGILIAVINSKKLLLVWTILLLAGSSAALIDFYLWLHKFGTELSSNAPIKVPGMTYIPPFLGNKSLLNFNALSLPYFGSMGIAIPLIAGILVFWYEQKRKKIGKILQFINKVKASAAVFLFMIIASCSTTPRAINYNEDQCELCKMAITERGYGSEMVTSKGKIYTFDSVECLASYVKENSSNDEILLVTDHSSGDNLVNAETAYYLESKNMPSPMGMNLTAFETKASADIALEQKGGRIISWDAVYKICR